MHADSLFTKPAISSGSQASVGNGLSNVCEQLADCKFSVTGHPMQGDLLGLAQDLGGIRDAFDLSELPMQDLELRLLLLKSAGRFRQLLLALLDTLRLTLDRVLFRFVVAQILLERFLCKLASLTHAADDRLEDVELAVEAKLYAKLVFELQHMRLEVLGDQCRELQVVLRAVLGQVVHDVVRDEHFLNRLLQGAKLVQEDFQVEVEVRVKVMQLKGIKVILPD